MSDTCDYEGYEFGGGYIDSTCIKGWLWDLDSCEEPGGPLYSGGEIPCPQCRHDDWLTQVAEGVNEDGWTAGYSDEPITDCPHPKEGAKYHQDSDGAVFRYAWLEGYTEGVLERLDDASNTLN